MVDVIQIDRDAAADILDEIASLIQDEGIGQVADLIRDGEYDEHDTVVRVARHRLAAQAHEPSAAVVERIRSILASQLRGGMAEIEPDTFVGNISDDQLTRVAAAMRPESGEPTPAMVNRGVEFAIRAKLSGEYTWPDYIADLYRTMRKEPSHD